MPAEIRRATSEDLDAIVGLESRCFEPARRASRASLRRSLTSRHQTVWVLGTPIAAYTVVWDFPRTVRLYDLATAPEARGKGYAGQLMDHVEAEAVKAGRKRIVLEAQGSNQELRQWYERRGYVEKDLRADFYLDGSAAVRMEKSLRPVPA